MKIVRNIVDYCAPLRNSVEILRERTSVFYVPVLSPVYSTYITSSDE